MNFNAQELNSFLSLPTDSNEQLFPTLTPQRSGSPRSILSEQHINSVTSTNALGGFRTRARAGTLPSRFQSSYSPSLKPTSSATSHGFDPIALNIENLTLSPSVTDSSALGSGSTGSLGTRLRSGSLLGLSDSNSIWNDNASVNTQTSQTQSSIHSMSSLNSLAVDYPSNVHTPTKQPFLNHKIEDQLNNSGNRARAYSANNVLATDIPGSFYLQNLEDNRFQQQQQQIQQQFNHVQHSQHDQINGLPTIAELQNRPRAQTYQNGTQSSLPVIYNTRSSTNGIPDNSELTSFISQPLSTSSEQPLLLDNIDPRLLNWTSTYQDPSLGPSSTLFLSNLPPQAITSLSLANLLMQFGRVVTVRIFTGNASAIVEFDSLEVAMQAKAQLNHQELMPGFPCLVTFAKVLSVKQHSSQQSQLPQASATLNITTLSSNQPTLSEISVDTIDVPVKVLNTISENPRELEDIVNEIYDIVTNLGVDSNGGSIHHIVLSALKYEGYDNDFGPLPDPIPIREFDAPKLREARKLIDANSMSREEIEELSLAILDELPELSSDYLGNTVVQKLFEFSSTSIKYIMLKEVSPFLAQMGIHKNGTWSAQRMINVADSPIQKKLVAESLKAYCVPLLNDQFGNYVIQASLKFGPLWNDFIFEVILAKFWLIAQNRFGARAVRACLESNEASVEQTAIISAAIILHAEHLAINQNASLLITWFLDTCTLPNRHILLAPKLIPHLAQLCTHKLASLTILKILNNRHEDEAKAMILTALFGPVFTDEFTDSSHPDTLRQILQDNVQGVAFILKVISNPQLNTRARRNIISQIKSVLCDLNVSSYQGYKRLMDEIGLCARGDTNRHHRTHSNGGGSTRNKGKQIKTSPQNPGTRRSTSNAIRGLTSSSGSQSQNIDTNNVVPPPQPQFTQVSSHGSNQFISNEGFFQIPQHHQQSQHQPQLVSGPFNDRLQQLSHQLNNRPNPPFQPTLQFEYGAAQY